MKKIGTVTMKNLKNMKAPYLIMAALFIFLLISHMIRIAMAQKNGVVYADGIFSAASLLWLLLPLAAYKMAAVNSRKCAGQGITPPVFWGGSILASLILSAAVSLANMLLRNTYDKYLISTGYFSGVLNLPDVFSWTTNDPALAFLRQTAFLFLLAAFVYLLASIQALGGWWAAAVVLLCVVLLNLFGQLPAVRNAYAVFVQWTLLQPNAVIHIATCLLLALLLFALSLPAAFRSLSPR